MTSVQLGSCLNEISRREMVEDRNSYKILGVRWYANGAWIKEEKKGNEIKAKYLYKVKSGVLIYNRLFAWKGAFAVVPENLNNCYVSNEFPVFKVKDNSININFMFLYLSKPSLWDQIERQSSGVSSISRKRFKASDFLKLEICLPEIKKQNLIINGYRKIKKHQENIQGLQNDNSSMCVKLRQAILQLAVQGKLVPQDPKDEPSSILLEKIKTEKERLIKEGKIKKGKPLPPITADEMPYKLPVGWKWCRFPEIGEFGRGKSKHRPRNAPELYIDGTIPLVQTGDVARSNGIINTCTGLYNENGLAQSKLWKKGTMCITIAANIADSGILGIDACFPDSVVGFVPSDKIGDAKYFEYFMRTAKSHLTVFAPSTAQKNINLGILRSVLIPLPPAPEIKRIVAKADELMALCDELETRLSQSQTDCDRLMEAAVAEILAA